jgi:N-acetyl-gamma-glutamyl-phosphate reductase
MSYKLDQHLGEINQSVNQLQADYANELIFCTEQRRFCKRNFATLYTTVEESLEDLVAKYEVYKDQPRNRYHYEHQHETSSAVNK